MIGWFISAAVGGLIASNATTDTGLLVQFKAAPWVMMIDNATGHITLNPALPQDEQVRQFIDAINRMGGVCQKPAP